MAQTSPRIAVVGLGSVGSMVLWRLAARGADVVGYEQFGLGHDRGAHGGESRIFRTAYFEDPEYVPLLRLSHRLWRELESEAGASLLFLTGLLMLGEPGSLGNVHASVERYGVDAVTVPAPVARSRWPQHPIRDDDEVVLDREAGYLRPEAAVLQAALRARALGAELRTHTRVQGVEAGRSGVLVRTGEGRDAFDAAVVAAGPWSSPLLPALAPRIRVRRPVSAWFPARNPEFFRPDRFPPFIRTTPRECYGLAALDGSGLKLGLSSADNADVADPERLERTVPMEEVARFCALVQELLPGLHPEPSRVSAYMEGYSPDGHGLVGALPGAERLTVVAALSGHGFKMAPGLAQVAADFALDGGSPHALALLEPGRFAAAPG